MTKMTPAEGLAQNPGPLARRVLEYSIIFKRIVDEAKGRTVTPADWAPLAELISVDEFQRVGVTMEVMDWPTYAEFLSNYANAAGWKGYFRRVTEAAGLVFLELEEHSFQGDKEDIANTVTVYAFNAAGKIRHLDVYFQHAM